MNLRLLGSASPPSTLRYGAPTAMRYFPQWRPDSRSAETRPRTSRHPQTNLRIAPMLYLRTFGGAAIVADDGTPLDGVAGQRRLIALLSILAVAGPGGVS